MDFRPSLEQRIIQETVRRQLEQEIARMERRGRVLNDPAGAAKVLWRQALDFGWIGFLVSEDKGGAGMGLVETALFFEEIGRAGAPGPFLANVALLPCLSNEAAGGTERDALHAAVLAGERVLVLGNSHPGNRSEELTVEFHRLATDAAFYSSASGSALASTRIRSTQGLTFADCATFDINSASGVTKLTSAEVASQYQLVTDDSRLIPFTVAVAAEIVGLATRAFDDTLLYVKERKQFGRPIGSFQAVKHRLVDCYVRIENARTALHFAALSWDRKSPNALTAARIARAYCGMAGPAVVEACIQLQGGFGFTWECGLHARLRRIRQLDSIFGTRSQVKQALVNDLARSELNIAW